MRTKTRKAIKARKTTRAELAVMLCKLFLEKSREAYLDEAGTTQMWVLPSITPTYAANMCAELGFELATVGRETRGMEPLRIKEKEKPRIIEP
jgi:hypothetical protein